MKNYRPLYFVTTLIFALGIILGSGCSEDGGGGGTINPNNNPPPPANAVGIDAKNHSCFSRPQAASRLIMSNGQDGYYLDTVKTGDVLTITTSGGVTMAPGALENIGPEGMIINFPSNILSFIGGNAPGSSMMYAKDEGGQLVIRPTFIGSGFTYYHTSSRKFKLYLCIWDLTSEFGNNSGIRTVTTNKSTQATPYTKSTVMVDLEETFGWDPNTYALFENIDVLLNDRLEFNIPGRSLWTTNGFGALIPPVSPLNGHNPLWVNGNSVSSQYPTYIFGFPRGFNSLFRGGEWWGSLGIRIANTVLPVPQQGILTAPNPGDLFIYPVNHPNFIGTPPNEKALGSTFVTVTAQ